MTPTLYIILLLMVVAVPLLIVFDGRNVQKRRAGRVAKEIFDLRVKVFDAEQWEYREVSLASFPDVDVGFYDTATRELEAQGFSQLGDIQNISTAQATNLQSPMRVMVDHACSSVAVFADIYSPKSKSHQKVIELTTEFSDNLFLETSNAPDRGYTRPLQIQVHRVPDEASAKALFVIHRNRLEEHHSRNPRIDPRSFNSIQAVIEGWSRSHILRVNHRKTLSTEQLRQEFEHAMTSKKRDPLFIAAVAIEYEKLYKQYRAKNQSSKS
jgi:hypothetical protein